MTLDSYLRRRNMFEVIFAVALATLIGIVSATSLMIEHIREGAPSRWVQALATELTATWTVLILLPVLAWFIRRLNLTWANFRWRVLWHLPAYVCFSLAHVALFVGLRKILWTAVGQTYTFGPLLLGLLYEMRKGLLIYLGLVLLIYGYQFILGRLQGEAGFVGTEANETEPYTEQFLVKMLNRQYLVKAVSIEWAQSASNYVILHCGQREYPMRQTISGLAEQLNPQQFVRVHRSAIVNISKVVALQEGEERQLELESGTKVPVSKTCLPALKQALLSASQLSQSQSSQNPLPYGQSATEFRP